MSANAGDGAGGGGERPGGFSRFMRRASSVLRRDRTKRQSVSGNPALVSPRDDPATTSTPAEAQPATQESAIEEPAMEEPAIQEPTTQKPAIQQPATQEPTTMAPAVGAVAPPLPSKDKAEDRKSEAMPSKPQSATTAAENNKIQEEKARALFAKYNMTLEIGEWTPPFKADAVRVERKVRIRIHRHCHRCQTVFGLEKQCTECGHTRCKKCPRTNMRNRQERKGKSVVTGGIVVDDKYVSMMGPDVLNMPYRRTGKELSDAASRICHKCQTTFAGNALQCGACGHQRCAQCPQDPPLSTPMAEGSLPRRRELRAFQVRVRWTCHECDKTFKDLETKCSNCGHPKCDNCKRDPAVEEEQSAEDQEALRSVEERLRNLEVSPQAAAA